MKLTFIVVCVLFSSLTFAGRPTPKGTSISKIRAVMETVGLGSKILSVRLADEKKSLYIIEFETGGSCTALGYNLSQKSHNPKTGSSTFQATYDGLRRRCIL